MMHDTRLRTINADLYVRMRRLIGAMVQQGIGAGRYRRMNVTDAAAVILGLLDGISLQLTFDPKAFTVRDAVRFCEEALQCYLRTGPGRGQ